MPVTTIRRHHQITIPRTIREKLHLTEGDQVEIREESGQIVIKPVKMIPADQAYFWSPEWQAMEREADADILKDRTIGVFENAKDAIRALKNYRK